MTDFPRVARTGPYWVLAAYRVVLGGCAEVTTTSTGMHLR